MQLYSIDYLLWAAGFIGEVILLGVLLTRRRARVFPFFTALVVEMVTTTIILFYIDRYGTRQDYLVGFLSTGFVDLVLQACVFYELASSVFRPVGTWAVDVRQSFVQLICGSVVIAFCLTWITTPPNSTWMRSLVIRGNFFSSVLMCELFVGMMVLSTTVKLPWKTHSARIAQGLGFYSLVGVLTEAAHSLLGLEGIAENFSHVQIFCFIVCVGYWIVMLWREAPAPKPLPEAMRLQLAGLQRRLEWDLQRVRVWKR